MPSRSSSWPRSPVMKPPLEGISMRGRRGVGKQLAQRRRAPPRRRQCLAGATSPTSREQPSPRRVGGHAGLDPPADLHGDGHAVNGEAVEIVRRSVERVNDPPHAAGAIPLAALLAEDAVVGTLLLEGSDD